MPRNALATPRGTQAVRISCSLGVEDGAICVAESGRSLSAKKCASDTTRDSSSSHFLFPRGRGGKVRQGRAGRDGRERRE